LSAILIGGLYPAIIQQFVVKPNELAKETPYIHKEIQNHRQALRGDLVHGPGHPVLGGHDRAAVRAG